MEEKTFDQLLFEKNEAVLDGSIAPSKRIPTEIILEPLSAGIRVTARNEKHHTLWGFTASDGSLKSHHTLVAVYPKLKAIINEALEARGLINEGNKVADLEDVLARLKVVVSRVAELSRGPVGSEKKREQIATAIDSALRTLEIELGMGTK